MVALTLVLGRFTARRVDLDVSRALGQRRDQIQASIEILENQDTLKIVSVQNKYRADTCLLYTSPSPRD